ncbi:MULTISPECIES: helix-turn-helix domain-containing protein [unclassified Undibacterium]|uniref:helix-turn-helix domain-containing protein n=1 Tax=unclassified Undibacterium TaxID=2630295 RepID=UPI002AC8B15E|nr:MULTISPECIES: helix-turn-helix domain-containing protein [unclassified Undibacterium]MEB0140016.1 helix-turn-helix domain-containing protein [Undibacterium sp. CCC2.1]MEB0173036.1 helix-turn-helix domain-containing protein [Undibacterium sp. CCC1.1]MEB0176810.1 helix-turn-helix domain-containing protein [Undibacterium sp. CCC3.4]MEB0216042.1 helix-turn-helix domain-containing protein [Undibacterium sp. 5I2]WPX42190.1 helix-turn-helix domain-containing protein [Undibacterium sp. CCC3.4]
MKKVTKTVSPYSSHIADVETLGHFIRAQRTAEGLTIEQAALSIGIAKQTLADLEKGKSTVGIGIVLRIVSDLGLNLFVADKQDSKAVTDFIRLRPYDTGRIK